MRITEHAGRGGRKVRNKGDNNKRTTNTMCGMAVNADDREASGKGGGHDVSKSDHNCVVV